MDVVVDTSAIMAVLVGEPEREQIIALTTGHVLIGPGSIPWELGNAFTAMLKQKRLDVQRIQEAMVSFESIPIRYVTVDMANAMSLAHRINSYAYDAYFLDCAIRHGAPILTLDRGLARAAKELGVRLMEK